MDKNEKSANKKNNSDDQGKLSEMNDSSASKKKESATGTAKQKGTIGEMNGKAEKK